MKNVIVVFDASFGYTTNRMKIPSADIDQNQLRRAHKKNMQQKLPDGDTGLRTAEWSMGGYPTIVRCLT